ncbi:RagB/SusD family nutrient uptake outer membrane protein [Chitinophaga lutea]|uniref:RagB/SusD family nutrient uptake outer membrane protein n=1 Tax=Chitinophaga lutea TaxID=2488634 RepID=A0A3N4PR45_9BACT|nr:RagB/SusD family nutrient uptake outer membrane protein [Chitinophaga lutea]RPE09219.1 RagB/SusD family nutrient uptake outer membrane protein [Chitinophaga lutea]
MKSYIIPVLATVFLLVAPSCSKDYLEKTPDEDLTQEQVFTNPVFAEQFLANIYSHLPKELAMVDNPCNGCAPNNVFNAASDELEIGHEPNFSNAMNNGNWNADSYVQDIWSHSYFAIRKANIFLENIDRLAPSELASADRISNWKGEALFLRALNHFFLIRVYGPVPVIDRTLLLDEDLVAFKRQPIEKCVEFIVAECDKAAALLPARVTATTDYGKPSKATCAALKARVLLYMASPLWNGNPDYAAFKDKDGVRLFPDAVPTRWQDAATAAKACIDLAESAGHKLHRSGSNPVKNYSEIFYVNFNDEVFFTSNDPGYLNIDAYSEPRGMPGANWPLQAATQNIVDDYEMADGTRPILGYNANLTPIVNPASAYNESTQAPAATDYYYAGTRGMYVGREPRFYASISFTGAKFKTGAPQNRVTPLQFWKGGLDGRPFDAGANFSETGYLMRKLTNPFYVMQPKAGPIRTWVFFRLGEQYLNYAEALNEAQGPVADVYKYVNLIRERAGLPGLPTGLSQADMRERIRHERRIELAFETHRYFDTHRWKTAETTDNGNIYGIDVLMDGYNISSNAFYARRVMEKRVFEKKHYLWPIQQRELEKNRKLVQNPGW